MMAYGEEIGGKLAYARANELTDRAPLIAQVADLQKSIEEAHLRLNRIAGLEPSPSDARPVAPDPSGQPLALRIQGVSALVGDCHRGVVDLIRRIDRLGDEANALA